MDKLKMHSPNKVDKNIELIGGLFPNCLVETKNENGIVKQAIDFDKLRQELSKEIVEGNKERYQFTWPDKKQAILLANSPIEKTLRPCREESVDFDHTENLYIEGDNLDVLKLLQETYLNKVKMIYIDPPYNTGNDFVYEDNFSQSTEEYIENSGQLDEEGNRLVQNNESNGRFHTDWLNMIYPRLKVAKDLLTEDGVIFISIDDHEVENLKKICNEIFGERNFIELFSWNKTSTPASLSKKSRKTVEYILCYEKNKNNYKYYGEDLSGGDQPLLNEGNNIGILKIPKDKIIFNIDDGTYSSGQYHRIKLLCDIQIVNGQSTRDLKIEGRFKWQQSFLDNEIKKGTTFIIKSNKFSIRFQRFEDESYKTPTNYIKENIISPLLDKKNADIDTNETSSRKLNELFHYKVFDFPKPVSLIKYLTNFLVDKNELILDFFSGSATTAHAVMQLNAEDKGNRKYIMVQLPEQTNEKSEAFKAGYKNICEIGKERIRRAGKKIVDELEEAKKDNKLFEEEEDNYKLDTGFRVLKLDSTNMKNVFYEPSEYTPELFSSLTDNIKEDRTPEDLLFQVMLELGVPLSHKIVKTTIKGKEVFNVNENYLIACFDDDVLDETVESIAKQKPMYAVFRDSSKSSDSVATNFEQLFKTFSPDTIRKVL